MTCNELQARVKEKWESRLHSARNCNKTMTNMLSNDKGKQCIELVARCVRSSVSDAQLYSSDLLFPRFRHGCVESGRKAAYLSSVLVEKIISGTEISHFEIELKRFLSPVFFVMQLSSGEDKETRRSHWRKDELSACVLTTNWEHHGELSSLARVTLLTGVYKCVLLGKARRTGCATTFVSAQRVVMLLLFFFFFVLYTKWKRKRAREREKRLQSMLVT